jgi:hypothetical protein
LFVASCFVSFSSAAQAAEALRIEPAGTSAWNAMRAAGTEQPPSAGAQVTADFFALGDDFVHTPPNPNGAVGPSHVMTMLNSDVRVQTREGTDLSTVTLAEFWTVGTGLSGTPFNPRLQYDPADARWIATVDADASSATSAVWFAISDGADPTGTWTFYAFDADAADATWAEFPGLASNANWIAITNNMRSIADPPPPGIPFKGVKMWVIGKSSALDGEALDVTVFDTGFAHSPVGCEPSFGGGCNLWSFAMMPAVAPGDGGPMYLVDNAGFSADGLHQIRLSEISGTESAPVWSPTADGAGPDPGTGFFAVVDDFENPSLEAAQPDSASGVDTGDFRISANAVYRDGSVWFAHHGGLPLNAVDRTAVFWYEVDPSLLGTTGAPILQSGIVDGGAGVHHFYPSIAVNSQGDACLGFARSSSEIFVEGVVAGRAAGDPAGAMGPIEVAKAGEATYLKPDAEGTVRWGEYTATVVDPVDGSSFWTIQEYAETDRGKDPEDDRWGTWWAQKSVSPGSTTSTTSTTVVVPTTSSTTTTLAADACGDPLPDAAATASALVTASDALFILRAAVGSESCNLCVCDVDTSGAVAASDALAVLQFAVGIDVAMSCPPCSR